MNDKLVYTKDMSVPPVGYIGRAKIWNNNGWEDYPCKLKVEYVGDAHWIVSTAGTPRKLTEHFAGGDLRFIHDEPPIKELLSTAYKDHIALNNHRICGAKFIDLLIERFDISIKESK